MTMKDRLRAWRQRYREYRIRERDARRAARALVEEADRDVGHRRPQEATTRPGLTPTPRAGADFPRVELRLVAPPGHRQLRSSFNAADECAWVGHNRTMSEEAEREYVRWEIATGAYVDEVMEIAMASPMHTGSKLDHANRELIVIGVGEPTEALANAMKQAPESIRVTWQEAPYTLAELSTEVLRIMSEQGGRLNSGWPLTGGTGIGFTTTDESLLEMRDPQAALRAHYPVTIEYGGSAIPL